MPKRDRKEYMHNYHLTHREHRLSLYRDEYKKRMSSPKERKQSIKRASDWRKTHPDYLKNYRQTEKCKNANRQRYWKLRRKIIELLGGKCVRCGEIDIRILQINHKNHDGKKEHNSGKAINKFYRAILNGERPKDDLEIRCANCNIIYEYETGRRKLYEGTT